MNTICANMILGEKPEPFLEYSLNSIKWVDELVIVNTGSKDNLNINIAKSIVPHAKYLDFFNSNLPFTFSNARNYALDNSSAYWILWIDADEVHYNHLERILRESLSWTHYDGFQFCFYHFLLDVFHYQHKEYRKNVFKRIGRRWNGDVHEQVYPLENTLSLDYFYHHYGYVKPQHLIYENWKLYWSLNPEEKYKLNENRNPNDIISDRVTVAHEYTGLYPEVIQEYIKKQKPIVKNYNFL